MRSKTAQRRDKELRQRTAELWIPNDVFGRISTLVRGAHKNYEEADAAILNVPQDHVADLLQLVEAAKPDTKGATLHLNYLQMIELEQISRYAERWGDDFADTTQSAFSQAEIRRLTEHLEQYAKTVFPD